MTKTSLANFPNIEHKGDVFQADFTEYEGQIDLLCGGSPCTYWSIAQSHDRRETTASGLGWELFQQYVKALHEAKPRFFIYENNKSMSKAIRNSIRETFGFTEVLINSALVSAQNRERFYWVGKRNPDGTYSKVNVPQPADRKIFLKDVVETGLPVNTVGEGKAITIKAQYGKNGFANFTNGAHRFSSFGASAVAEPVRIGTYPRQDGTVTNSRQYRVYSLEGKSVALSTASGGMGVNTGLYAFRAVSAADGKSYPVYKVENEQISIKGKSYPMKLPDGLWIIRKLTVKECARLQTVPAWYKFPVSDTRAYTLLGNGWTVEVIRHLLGCCLERKEITQQTTLF